MNWTGRGKEGEGGKKKKEAEADARCKMHNQTLNSVEAPIYSDNT